MWRPSVTERYVDFLAPGDAQLPPADENHAGEDND